MASKGSLFRFYVWVSKPTSEYVLRAILKTLTDQDLIEIMMKVDSKQALTIAWAEYGRRHANVKLEFVMKAKDMLEVSVKDLVLAHQVALA